ncbi:MAG TPA: class I SAM-dependent methyltransferase [Candidatus Sulfotelmatobacter sp.]|jgi:2-polyprenyl-3-methyl-5-hydroxy-6-metoxy-1,4-benzoquinol methylase
MTSTSPVATAIGDTQSNGNIECIPQPCCPLCGRDGQRLYAALADWLFGVSGNWNLDSCRTCDIAWLDPQPIAEDIPKLYSSYHTHRAAPPARIGRLRSATHQCVLAGMGYPIDQPKEILPRLLSHVPSIARAAALGVMSLDPSNGGTLLDVGCGNGEFIGRMRSFGWNVSGVDPDPAAVQKGRNEGLNIFAGRISDVPGNMLYDVITLSHVIEHVSDPVDLLSDCRKRLRPETGILVITTPNIKSLGHRWFKNYWRGLEIPRHLILFSPDALSTCIARSGLYLRSMRTETRIARLIYPTSACAKNGNQNVGERTGFSVGAMCMGYAFQFMEDVLTYFKKDLGEEIYCVCTAPAEDDGHRN